MRGDWPYSLKRLRQRAPGSATPSVSAKRSLGPCGPHRLVGATGKSPVARSSEEDPTRPHVALAVEDIQEARRELEARGIRHWTIRGLVGDNSDQVFVPDPFNNIVELHQIGTGRCNRVTLEGQG